MIDQNSNLVSKTASMFLLFSSLFALYTCGTGFLSAINQRAIHWILLVVPLFLTVPAIKDGKTRYYDLILAVLGFASTLYLILTWQRNAMRVLEPTSTEIIFGVIMILIVLEATRRTIGYEMSLLCVIALGYAFLGPYIPGSFGHKGFTLTNLVSYLYSTTEGIMGITMGVSATYIIIFMLFGAFLASSGAGKLFVDMSLSVTGRLRSGPAQSTILCNALMGIISGSPVANVVTTGAFTLPLLEKVNYPMKTGAALLAVAATGAMFTPPVMGAGAFMIADYMGVNYSEVVLASIIPAFLFYVSLIVYADIGAAKGGLHALKKEELPNWKAAFLEKGLLLIPIVMLVVLIVKGWSATKSAFWSILAILAISWIKKSTRMHLMHIVKALIGASKDALGVAAACASAGIIVGVISATGLGIKFSSLLIHLSANSPLLAMFLTMLAATVLGLALPATAVYIVMAALTVPSLISIGINPMAAHFFVFFYACLGAITPPVALSAYAAAAIAKTNPNSTGWLACRMGLVAYVIPFIFAANPVLLMQGSTGLQVLLALIPATLGVVFFTYAVDGFFKRKLSYLVRIVLFLGSIGLMVPQFWFNLGGAALTVLAMVLHRMKRPEMSLA